MRGILIVLLVVLVGVVGLGFYLEWWGFSRTRDAEGKGTGVTFNVNRERIAEDAKKAGGAIRNLGKKVQPGSRDDASREAAATQTVKGTLKKVEAAEHRLTITTPEDRPVTVETGPATKIRRNDVEVRLNELMEGDRVVVQCRDENGKRVAQSVTVEPSK
jgi:Cu/Ag efflux protein CusF